MLNVSLSVRAGLLLRFMLQGCDVYTFLPSISLYIMQALKSTQLLRYALALVTAEYRTYTSFPGPGDALYLRSF